MNNNTLLVFILLFFAWNANAANNSTSTSDWQSKVQPTVNGPVFSIDSKSASQIVSKPMPAEAAHSCKNLSPLNKEYQSYKTSKNGTLNGPVVVEEALVSIYGRYKESANPNFRECLLA